MKRERQPKELHKARNRERYKRVVKQKQKRNQICTWYTTTYTYIALDHTVPHTLLLVLVIYLIVTLFQRSRFIYTISDEGQIGHYKETRIQEFARVSCPAVQCPHILGFIYINTTVYLVSPIYYYPAHISHTIWSSASSWWSTKI